MNQTIQNQIQQFPFISKTIIVHDFQENIRVDQILISNDKKYISFITTQRVEMNHIKSLVKQVKLYHLETMQFLKQLENESNWQHCLFSKNSKIFIFLGQAYYMLYNIASDQIQRIETTEPLKFSYDAQIYLCEQRKSLNLLGHQYYNVKNSLWQFSQQNNQLISLRKSNNYWCSLQYRRIKYKKLKITLDIKIQNTLKRYFELKFFEQFASRIILLYSQKIIQIYNLKGKLIRNIRLTSMNAKCESINVYNDKNDKPILLNVFSALQSFSQTYKTIGYVSLLPEVKIYMNEIITNYLICFNIHGVVTFQTTDLQANKGTINYLDQFIDYGTNQNIIQ